MYDTDNLEALIGRSVAFKISGVEFLGTVESTVPACGGQVTAISLYSGTPYTFPVDLITEVY
jgi:hypothetical protein